MEGGKAYPTDAVPDSKGHDGWPDDGQQVDMAVSVHMARLDACLHEFRELRLEFLAYSSSGDPPRKHATDQGRMVVQESTARPDQRSERLGCRKRSLLDPREVQADVQFGAPLTSLDAVVERLADNRERSTCNNPVPVRSLDASVYVRMQAEIIGVHHKGDTHAPSEDGAPVLLCEEARTT
jgi:hypothetical protein